MITLKTTNDLLHEALRTYGDKTAFISGHESISFSEMGQLSREVAQGLYNQGVRKGDRVALFLRNVVQFPFILFGTLRIGAIPTLINAFHKGEDVFWALSNTEPKVLFVEGELFENIQDQVGRVKSVKVIYSVDSAGQTLDGKGPLLPMQALLAEGDIYDEVTEEDIAAIVHTAGTEGRPRGVMITHKGVVRDIMDRDTVFKVSPDLRTLVFAPFFHIAGFRHLLMSIHRGNTTYIMPFNPEKVLRLIHNEKIGYVVGSPAVYHLMFRRDDFKTYDLSSLKVVGVGGAPSTPDFVSRLFKLFPQALIYNGYGQTELMGIGCNIDNVGDDFKKRPHSVGKIWGGHELEIVDGEGKVLPPKEVGEIIVRDENCFKGYWNDPEATSKKIMDGWVYTGDLGWQDEEGFLYLTGRKSDMVIRGGENVYPQEVENCLEDHPAVEEVAIIGVPDNLMGEEIKAFIQLRKGAEASEDEIKAFCRSRIAKFKIPKYVEFIDEMPHVAAGKIDRKLLRMSNR